MNVRKRWNPLEFVRRIPPRRWLVRDMFIGLGSLRCSVIKLFYYLIGVIAVWLAVSPFVLGYQDVASIASAVAVALVVGVLVVLGVRRNASAPSRAIVALGAILAVWGVVGLITSFSAGVNEIIVGLLVLLVAAVIPTIVPDAGMVAYDVYGNPMAQIKQITIKNGDLAAKAVLLGSMPATMYLRPEEVWKALGMVSFGVIMGLPKFLVVGAKRANNQAAETAN